ncbi:MAG: tyrosine-type recombinase/integrase [Candidatus Omnitrophica bacterium]|nr:tyrosine-type recombinase/integrase [Candidatus Omnitrophota bacterium]
MKNKTINYSSSLASILAGYVEEKRAVGYKYNKGASTLKLLDNLLVEKKFNEKILTKEIVLLWTKKKIGEKDSTRNARISLIKGVALYMVRLRYEAYIYPDKAAPVDRYHYVPYIFSEEELAQIFTAADNIPYSSVSPVRHLTVSLLFRLLYGCGLRISEALNLKIADVNLEDGILSIRQAKLEKDRIVPMSKSLIERCKKYSREAHRAYPQNPYFFPSPYGGRYSDKGIYDYFRRFLWSAGISHGGRGYGPRVHDLRHCHAVHCLKKWVKQGEDLTALLPYLSAYLGHVDLRGSQHYLRLTADLYPTIVSAVEANYSNLIPEVNSYESN